MIRVFYKTETKVIEFKNWEEAVENKFCSLLCTKYYQAVIDNQGFYEDNYYIIEEISVGVVECQKVGDEWQIKGAGIS